MSDGLALTVEDCFDANEMVSQIKAKVELARRGKPMRRPIGTNGWMLAMVLGCLAAEWLLRKRWSLS